MIATLVLASLSLHAGLARPGADLVLLPHAELRAALAALAAEHPELASVVPVGTSREGRVVEGVRLAAGEVKRGRPGILIVAGLDGPRVFESALALDLAERLCTAYGVADDVTALLDGVTVYLIPRANPGAAEARFDSPRQERWATGRGIDDDRDDRQSEDPPADVDGDGLVTWMRVPDPDGTWIADPHDPRANLQADPQLGQRGAFRLEREGFDADADERVAEDGPGDTVLNANFPAGWEEHAPGAGLFPTDEPEVRALCEFVLQHVDLALVLCYGELDTLVELPAAAGEGGRVPDPGLLEDDRTVLEPIAERYREATGDANEGGHEDAGSFQRWCYEHRGLWTLSANVWSLPDEAPRAEAEEGEEEEGLEPDENGGEDAEPDAEEDAPPDEPSDDAGRLAWIDAAGETWRFSPWRPFEHPQLGPVEVGGFAPFALVEPPQGEWRALADAQLAFVRTLGDLPARLSIASFVATDLGGGLLRIEATLERSGLLPLLSASARRARTPRPVRAHLSLPAGASLLAGEFQVLVDEVDAVTRRRELTWLVSGSGVGEVSLSLDSDHAGSARVAAEVAR